MKVASHNEDPRERQHYTCNVCGMEYPWSEDHHVIERGVGTGYQAYEVNFITCSDICREKAREIFIKWLSKYDGWNKKKATENWDKHINNTITN